MPSAEQPEQWQWDSFGLIDQDLNRILWADLNNNLLTFRDRPDVKPLLAATPDLRDACEELMLCFCVRSDGPNTWDMLALPKAYQKARAAIAKAKPNIDAR